jgi:hypothetical protein
VLALNEVAAPPSLPDIVCLDQGAG